MFKPKSKNSERTDVVVIGSGFGGAVSALRLTEKGYRVDVLEAGRRFSDSDFPDSNWDLKRYLWAPKLGMYGIQRIHPLNDVLVLAGAGVGGGSLNYACTLYRPGNAYFQHPQWQGITDWKAELDTFYDQAQRMMGVSINPTITPSDRVVKHIAERMGREDTFRRTPVGVFFGDREADSPAPKGKPEPVADPFFGGVGPSRVPCTECGECMTGCRHNSKNTLVKNYLYLAEKAGAKIHPMTTVIGVEQASDGSWLVHTRPTDASAIGALVKGKMIRAEHVIFSAGAWGTQNLLHNARMDGTLPKLSEKVGHLTRTNSEAILGASTRSVDPDNDYSEGVAITSSFFPEDDTHIEPVRYGKGSNAMALLQMVQTDGSSKVPRFWQALWKIVTHPGEAKRLYELKGWSQRTVILLVMQDLDNSLTTFKRKIGPLRWLASKQGTGLPNPKWIPSGNKSTDLAAEKMSEGKGGRAIAGGSISELLNKPTTAHFIGGAVISESPNDGVIDPYQRVWGYPSLSVHDGSALAANPGVNPALSILALAERACSMWPNKGEADSRPAQGEDYRVVEPVAPHNPVVPPGAPAAYAVGSTSLGIPKMKNPKANK